MSTLPHAPFLPEDDSRHGTVNGYMNWRCRCERCMEAYRVRQREYMRKYRAREKEQQAK